MLFNKKNLLPAELLTKNDNTSNRPEINGLHFEKDGTMATDSFSLIFISIPNGDVKDFPVLQDNKKIITSYNPFTIPVNTAKELKNILPDKRLVLPILSNFVISNLDKNTAEFSGTDLEQFKTIKTRKIEPEQKYPEWQTIEFKKAKAEVLLNCNYLERILKIAKEFSKENKLAEIKLEIPEGTTAPIRITAKNQNTQQEFKAYLMPKTIS